MNDFTVVAISLSIIVLCWVVVRINHRLENPTRNLKQHSEIDMASESSAGADSGPHC
jgi:hypothetical protein